MAETYAAPGKQIRADCENFVREFRERKLLIRDGGINTCSVDAVANATAKNKPKRLVPGTKEKLWFGNSFTKLFLFLIFYLKLQQTFQE